MKNAYLPMTRRTAIALCSQAAVFAGEVQDSAPPGEHDLHFHTPVTTWDEALPLGNGLLGALVWGDGKPLRISLDRSDLWDLRPVPEFHAPDYTFATLRQWKEEGRIKDIRRVYEEPYHRPAPTKIPAGRIEITFGDDARFAASRLRLGTAEATVELGARSASVFVHGTEPVGLLRITGSSAVQFRLMAPPFSGAVAEPAQGGITSGELAQLGYPAPAEASGEGWCGYVQEGVEGFRFAVHLAWQPTDSGWEAAWSVATSRETDDVKALARRRVQQALNRGYRSMMTSHRTWWTAFWERSMIRVPNKIIERQWYLDTYKFGSAARKNTPPISLQAVWTADNRKLPPWKGDYHHDLNTQLSYWPCYSGNHLEDGLGYLEWLWKTRDTAFAWTKRFYGLPGLNVPMTADLNGNQIGGWVQYTHSATTSAWLAHHFYLHWKYSADRQFLERRAYPYLRSASEFIEAFTAVKDANGKRTHPLSASPEINDNRMEAWFAGITNFDLALERRLLQATAELADELRLASDAARWRRVAGELPEFSLGEDGKLLVAPGAPLPASHRHLSHLMAIHPLGLIDTEDGADARRTVNASLAELDRLGTGAWCGYSFAWLANMAARAGDGAKAAQALEIFASAFVLRNSFHANGDQSGKGYSKFRYRPFTLEGNFASAAGLQEMLLQSHRGRIEVFPALPDSWKDVEFRSLRAQGAFLVSARKQRGEVRRISIASERGGVCRVLSPWTGKVIEFRIRAGQTKVLEKT